MDLKVMEGKDVALGLSERTPSSGEEEKVTAQGETEKVKGEVKDKVKEVEDAVASTVSETKEKAQAVLKNVAAQTKTKDGKGALWILRKTYEREGFKGWYVGMQAQILKAVLTQGEWYCYGAEMLWLVQGDGPTVSWF